MDTMISSGHTQASLPKLSTSKQPCRRDSLSSSRTRDSGYHSDLDSLSPLDVVGLDQDIPFAPLPCVPNVLVHTRTALWKRYTELDRPAASARTCITSNPALAVRNQHHPRTKPFQTASNCVSQGALECKLASQDEEIERWIKENLPPRSQPKERVSSIVSLSSTSSCDMYSNTDLSDEEHVVGHGDMNGYSQKSALKIIELIIRKVELNLRHAAWKQSTGGSTSYARAEATHSSFGQNSQKLPFSLGPKRKFRLGGSPPPEEDDEDGPNKRRRGSTTTITDDSETGARFACPFYKHDPDRYRSRRTCPGPGWPTVHRMKEHLYRSHSQPIFCPICYETFKSDKDQSGHVRLQQCQRSSPQQIEGIDRETVWTLRKRTTALRLEEDKWRDVYQVLFPDVSEADIPSPFYDCDSPSEASRRFRRELLRRVQEELSIEAGLVPSPVEQQLLRRVAHIIRRCEHDLLNQAQPPATPSFNTDRRASASSRGSSYQASSVSAHASLVEQRTSLSLPPASFGQSNALAPTEYASETTVDVAPIVWDDQSYNAFSLGIDWESIFPPAPDTQYTSGGELAASFSAPMWT